MSNLKDKILQHHSEDLHRLKSTPKEWGEVYCKMLSCNERIRLAHDVEEREKQNKTPHGHVLCATLCDKYGANIFSYPDDAELLNEKSCVILDAVVTECLRHNKMSSEDVANKKK